REPALDVLRDVVLRLECRIQRQTRQRGADGVEDIGADLLLGVRQSVVGVGDVVLFDDVLDGDGTVTKTLSFVFDSMLTSSCWTRREIGLLVVSTRGILKFSPGFATFLNFPNRSTMTFSCVFTVKNRLVRSLPNSRMA